MEIYHDAPPPGPSPVTLRRRRRLLGLGAIFLGVGLAAIALVLAALHLMSDGNGERTALTASHPVIARSVPPSRPAEIERAVEATSLGKDALETLTPDEARLANTKLAVVRDVGPAARPLIVPIGDGVTYLRALDCMTTAIYHEAALEPLEGQRAVAQVILNRARHSIYPHSICGVVFQGAERATGCQFSFTCDGAMQRQTLPAPWARARSVAAAALGGYVYAPVGLATHYHADYVLPRWAPTLVKQAVIGHHIFYRWPGGWGTPHAFMARYAGDEQDISARTDGMTPPLPADAAGAEAGYAARTDRPIIVSTPVAPSSTTPGPPRVAPPAAADLRDPGDRPTGATGGVIMGGTPLPPPPAK